MRIGKTITAKEAVTGANPSLTYNLQTLSGQQDASFIDLARTCSGWKAQSQDVDYKSNLDMSAVTGSGHQRDFNVSTRDYDEAARSYPSAPTHLNGSYVLRFNGGATASVSAVGNPSNFVEGSSGTATATRRAWDRSFTFDWDDVFSGNTLLRFTNITASDPPTDVRVIHADDVAAYDAGGLFHKNLLSALSGNAYGLRFMDWMETNGSPIVSWPTETPSAYHDWQGTWATATAYAVGDVVQQAGVNYICLSAHTSGTFYVDYNADEWACCDYPDDSFQNWVTVPANVMAALCNELGVHAWVHAHHRMTDAAITSLLTEMHNELDAGLFCDTEFSNEVWNANFEQADYIAERAEADWSLAGSATVSEKYSWHGKRFYEMMGIATGISASRFRGIIAGQRGSFSTTTRHMLDAGEWDTNDSGSYVAPHTRATFLSCTDYIGTATASTEAGSWSETLSTNWDGDRSLGKAAFLAYMDTSLAERKTQVQEHLDEKTATDTVDGIARSLRFRTYEGISNHINFGGNSSSWFSEFFRPASMSDGAAVINKEYRKNSFGRLYQAQNAGTMGASEPTHTDLSSVTVDGISWTDVTGIDSGWYRDLTSGSGTRYRFEEFFDWAASTAFSLNGETYVYVQNSNGSVYRSSVEGTSGTTEPTHLTGTVSDGVLDWEFVNIGLGELRPRPELIDWTLTEFYNNDMADYHIQLLEYSKANGGEGHAMYTAMGLFSTYGSWGKRRHWKDDNPLALMTDAWSRANQVWWAD